MRCPAQPLPPSTSDALGPDAAVILRAERPAPWIRLLARFYARAGLPLPTVTRLGDEQIPEPYRQLLAHSRDMTPTLEAFHGRKLAVAVLVSERELNSYLREVALRPSADAAPVEYGVIRIYLDRLPEAARRAVLEEERPFGDILRTQSIGHLSWPQAFFELEADGHIAGLLGVRRPARLYGRRNVLLDGSRRLLAEVIEVLPPIADAGQSDRPPSLGTTGPLR